MRRLPMFFNVIWFSLFFSFQVIKRRALKICLLETSVLLTITKILKRRTTYSYFDFGLKTAVFGCLTNALAPPPIALESC